MAMRRKGGVRNEPQLAGLVVGGRYEPWSRRLLRIKAGEAGNVVLFQGGGRVSGTQMVSEGRSPG